MLRGAVDSLCEHNAPRRAGKRRAGSDAAGASDGIAAVNRVDWADGSYSIKVKPHVILSTYSTMSNHAIQPNCLNWAKISFVVCSMEVYSIPKS